MAVNPNQIFSGFSLTAVYVLDGATAFEDADATNSYVIYGGRSATVTLNTASVDNTGEDTILETWNAVDNATVSIEAGRLSLPAYSYIYGESITSQGAGPNDIYSFDPWTEDSINAAAKPCVLVMRSKNLNKANRTLKFGLYSVEFAPIKFAGPQYRNVLTVTMEGKAGMSEVDEVGAALGKKSALRIIASA